MHMQTVSEVVSFIVCGSIDTNSKRDMIIQTQSGKHQRIDECHKRY
jgi:hypothetical protein